MTSSPSWAGCRTWADIHLVEVLHLVPVTKPGLFVLAGLDDEDLVVGKHLCETVGENLPHSNVQLVHLHLLFITLHLHILISAWVLFHIQLPDKPESRPCSQTDKKKNTLQSICWKKTSKALILKGKWSDQTCPRIKLHYHFKVSSL